MYPRNATNPEPVAIGPVIQITDGAVQTSGVTVRIKPVGVAEADGAGTTAYSTDGVVIYTPTQGETNYTSFVLIAKKTGCLPASQTVITSESTVSGRVYVQTIATAQINAIADQVWDEVQSQHTTAGTMGYFIGGVLIAANFNQRTVSVTGGPTPHIAASIHNAEANSIPAGALTTAAIAEIQSGLATSANQVVLIDGVGFLTAVVMGSISDAGTAAETYQIAFGGSTYTVDYSGLDATGNRSTTTRTKT